MILVNSDMGNILLMQSLGHHNTGFCLVHFCCLFFKVYLQRKDSVGCIFRLHPRIKVQSVGEEVNYDDQIKFESVATEGQYLHCSKRTFGDINVNAFSERLVAKGFGVSLLSHYYMLNLS